MNKIEWTDKTWNPITGCSKVSIGCKNCYAEIMARRLKAMGQSQYQNVIGDNGKWNGYISFVPSALEKPLRWKKPRMVFVNSMSDMFHENLSYENTLYIWRIMSITNQHTYQILTKRAQRAQMIVNLLINEPGLGILPNVWVGVSIENTVNIDRIEYLRATPSTIKFVSFEPLLSDVGDIDLTGIDWVIVGAESGHHARPMNENWVRRIRDNCIENNIPFFYKQRLDGGKKISFPELDGKVWAQYPKGKTNE